MPGYLQEKGILQFSLHVNWHLKYKPIPLLYSCLERYNSTLRSRMKKWGPVHFSIIKVCPPIRQRESNDSHPKHANLLVHCFCHLLSSLAKPKTHHTSTCNWTYFLVNHFCIYSFGIEFSMETKQPRKFLSFLMPTVISRNKRQNHCISSLIPFHVFTNISWVRIEVLNDESTLHWPLPQGDSISVSPSNTERVQENHPHNSVDPMFGSYSKPEKQETQTNIPSHHHHLLPLLQKKNQPTNPTKKQNSFYSNWKGNINAGA